MKIGVTGANGAVGKHLLGVYGGRDDVSLVACVRSQKAAESIPARPGITLAIVSPDDSSALSVAFTGCGAIIHLAGILFETRGSTYENANVGVTKAIVEAAGRLDNVHMIFVSALGADAKSRNRYLRSKGICEDLIGHAQLSSTVIRTPLLLGPGTAGGQTLLRDAQRRQAWLLGGGAHRLRPLDVDDLCRAMLGICRRIPNGKSVHNLVGPESQPYRELVQLVARSCGSEEVAIRSVPIGLAKLAASVSRMISGSGISGDVIDVITADEGVDRNAHAELGVDLTTLGATIEKLVQAGI